MPDGINFVGYLTTESGVGAAGRGYVRALRQLGLPLSLHDVSALQGNRAEDRTLRGTPAAPLYDLNIVCADVELHYAIRAQLGERFFEERYNVAIWAWELERFPERWHDRFAFYDEIWVGSSFIANALGPVSPLPVVRIPPALTVERPGSRERGRARLGAASDEFVALFIFDLHSHLARKNPLGLIEAFKLAFGPDEPARLVLKCVNAAADPAGFATLCEHAQGRAIDIYDGYWPSGDVRDLMAACDAYVSLHRAEGTGLTITDALALGKPVIATDWSGNMDYMGISNSFPVRSRPVELGENIGPYRAGEHWAEPSIEHAAALLRQVFDDRPLAQTRGEAARHAIETGFSEAAVATLIRQRLAAIATRRHFASFRREAESRYASYRQLGDRIRAAIGPVVPAEARVVVVSKGDEDLVRLDGRAAWHFPQTADGVYAGYYPADSGAAIGELEALRARGASHLLFPSVARWWLDHYADFKRHLEQRYRVILDQAEACLVFELEPVRVPPAPPDWGAGGAGHQSRQAIH